MSHCISHHIFHTPHHTRYALNCILHDTIPHYIITFCTSQLHFTPHSHIPHQFPYLTPNLNCNIPQCTSYYTFELHNSASCTIPRHSTVYFTSQHSVFHITPPQLFSITAHSTAHIHILHYTYRATHLTSLTIPHHHILPTALYITHILHHIQHHTITPHSTPSKYCTSQLHSTSHQTLLYLALPHHTMFHITPTHITFHSRLPHLTIRSSFRITPMHSTCYHTHYS